MGDHTFENVLRGFFARHCKTDISRSRVPVTSLCALISVGVASQIVSLLNFQHANPQRLCRRLHAKIKGENW